MFGIGCPARASLAGIAGAGKTAATAAREDFSPVAMPLPQPLSHPGLTSILPLRARPDESLSVCRFNNREQILN
ncbi:MAG TPA: hypothetical protein VFE47_14470 [Tepidisphaeraceae bacterium]|jgi:hypothetical protein|nr:hypothetical protein [Tepidisphaeraceae bacterium]